VPQASQLALYEALYELRMSMDAALDYMDDPATFAARYELSDAERDALVSLDEDRFQALGVHPLLGFLARLQLSLARAAARP
jgi:2,3-dihydroxyphenylpropionate 1,2-dioxygenase